MTRILILMGLFLTLNLNAVAGDFYSFSKDKDVASETKKEVVTKEQLILLEKAQELRVQMIKNHKDRVPPNRAFIFIDKNSLSSVREVESVVKNVQRDKGDVTVYVSIDGHTARETMTGIKDRSLDENIHWMIDANYSKASEFGIETFPAAGIIYKGTKRKLNRWQDLVRIQDKIGTFAATPKVSLKGVKLPEGVNQDALAKYN